MTQRLNSNSQGQRHGTEIDPAFRGALGRKKHLVEPKGPGKAGMTPWDELGVKDKGKK
ncbi:hypothetical protein HY988_03930 [Candidatus Micrarchaeota archaeon]|nr:hypothetical protein [Candidatus Micrarchaeota archaeon]